VDDRILVLLLPVALERFEHRDIVERLMRADGVVACDPPRTSYDKLLRLPDGVHAGVANKQAKRLRKRLPGEAAAVGIFDPGQYPLARGIIALVGPQCQLWYRPPEAPPDNERRRELHGLAIERARVLWTEVVELADPLTDLELSSLPERGGARRAGRR